MRPGIARAGHAALVAARDQLAGAGVPASLNRGDLRNLPAAWITPRAYLASEGRRLNGQVTLRAWVYLIVKPDTGGELATLDGLADVLDKALTAGLPLAAGQDVETAGVTMPNIPDPLPAWRLVVDLPVTPERTNA